MAEWKLAQWKREWDVYNDVEYFVNQLTGETRSAMPSLQEYLPTVSETKSRYPLSILAIDCTPVNPIA